MSSHHFVKDGQEPPLLVLDWNEKLELIAKELLEWQPKFIVCKDILDLVLISGLKPDGIFGMVDANLDYLQPLEEIEKFELFIEHNQSNILVQKTWQECISYFDNSNPVIYTSEYKIFKPTNSFSKQLPLPKKAYEINLKTQAITALRLEKNNVYLFVYQEDVGYMEEI